MARSPNYWPNSAIYVQVGPLAAGSVAAKAVDLLRRRRFACVSAPAIQPTDAPQSDSRFARTLVHAIGGLAYGEWVALYAALQAHIDPAERVPLELLFR
jgi:hypothetical protein